MPNTKEKLIDALEDNFRLMRECKRLKEENERLATTVNVLEERNSDLCKQLRGVTVQQWISVKDRLPEEDGDYLVHYRFMKTPIIARCGFAKDGEKVDEYDLKGKKNVWYDYDSEYGYAAINDITHWMPLPHLPKGE